jgi:hypothetical protein
MVLVFLSWFAGFMLAMIRLVGSYDRCRFGADQIVYHCDHGHVLGLEEARVGGVGLFALLIAAFLLIPFLAAIVYVIIFGARARQQAPREAGE